MADNIYVLAVWGFLDLRGLTFLRCGDMVAVLISQPLAAAFVRPVDPALVPGYADVVSTPMDLVSGAESPVFVEEVTL